MFRTVNRRSVMQAIGTAGAIGVLGSDSSAQEDDEDERPAENVDVETIAADPTDVPNPVDWDEPRHHELEIQTEEYTAEIEDGITYDSMTFDGQIPGPFIRVRQGDTIHLTFDVPVDLNNDIHSIDFHAVYRPGGGAADTTGIGVMETPVPALSNSSITRCPASSAKDCSPK